MYEGEFEVEPDNSKSFILGAGQQVRITRGSVGPITGINNAAAGMPPATRGSSDLSGLWVDDSGGGGIYRVRQVGNQVYWSVDAVSKGSFANFFHGEISDNTINGEWVDLPGSPTLSGGRLVLRIESNDRLVKVSSSNSYGAKEWRRQQQ